MENNPVLKISVIITCYNEGDLLLRAAESIQAQTDQDFEFLIINDFSQHARTNEICRQLEEAKIAKVIWLHENIGLSGARNIGFEKMQGNIAVFLDADDTLPPNAVSDARQVFTTHPEADFVYGDYLRIITETDEVLHKSLKHITNADGSLNPEELIKKWIILGTSPCKKSAWASVNGYSADFRDHINDEDFFMRMLMNNRKGFYTNSIMYNWYFRAGSISTSISKQHMLKLWTRNLSIYDRFGKGTKTRNLIVQHFIENYDLENARKFSKKFEGHISKRNKIKTEMLRFSGLFKLAKKTVKFLRKLKGKK